MIWSSLWRTESLVAVDMGTAALKVVEVVPSQERVVLGRCAIVAVEGQDYTETLRKFLNDTGIHAKQVSLGLASPEVIVKPFKFPRMPKAELEKAVLLQAEQAILSDYSLNDVTIDGHLLPPYSNGSIHGLFAVVPKPVLAARLQIARLAGLDPVVVDVEGLALWNAYWMLEGRLEPEPKTVLLLNVGAHTTNLVIARGPDELILLRDFQLGAQAIGKGQEKDWITEVRDSLGYARSECGLRSLDAAYVTGGGSSCVSPQSLESVVSLPIQSWNPLKHLVRGAQGQSLEESKGLQLAIAIGLALRRSE